MGRVCASAGPHGSVGQATADYSERKRTEGTEETLVREAYGAAEEMATRRRLDWSSRQ